MCHTAEHAQSDCIRVNIIIYFCLQSDHTQSEPCNRPRKCVQALIQFYNFFSFFFLYICDAIQQKVHKVGKLVFPNAVEIGIFIGRFEIFKFFTDFAIFWFFFLTFFIVIGNHRGLRPWNSWTVNSDKKYMELNGAALNVNKPRDFSENSLFER